MNTTFQTERLIIRPHRLEDFGAYSAYRADPDVMRYMHSGPANEEDSWLKFQSIAGHWEYMGYGNWAIEEKVSGSYIGNLGFMDKKRPSSHPASGAPEMGWLVAQKAWNKGYATEAVSAALVWARKEFGKNARVVCVIDHENIASQRVADRAGFKQFAKSERGSRERFVYERSLA